VAETIERLSAVIGFTVQPDPTVVEALQAENAALRKRAEDAEAKLALIREASGL
jgi:hypothetical protein